MVFSYEQVFAYIIIIARPVSCYETGQKKFEIRSIITLLPRVYVKRCVMGDLNEMDDGIDVTNVGVDGLCFNE